MKRTNRWRSGAPLVALLLALALISGARAGGWSVVTLDSGSALDPISGQVIRPGEPFSFGFIVRQHGLTPMADLNPQITATSQATGDVVTATARADGGVGHYVVTLTLPSAGTWDWQIDAFGPVAEMAPISVVAPAVAPAVAAWLIAASLLIVGVVGVGLVALRRRPRPAKDLPTDQAAGAP